MKTNDEAHHGADDRAQDGVLDDYMDDDDLARELGVTPRTVARWRALREAPPVTRIGRRVMYRREAVKKWLEERETEAA